MMYVAVPLMADGTTVGVVRTSIPVSAVDEALHSIYGRIALGGLAVAALAAVISFFISRRISRPLEAMRRGADRFAQGELDHRMEVFDYVEFESLAKAMNHMASRLDERIRTVIHQRNEQKAVLASMVEGVLAVDNEERIINLNKAAAEMIGVNPEEAMDRTLQEVIRNPALQEFVAHTRESEFPVEGDIELGEDRDRFVQTHGTVLRGADGKGIGVLVVLNDVTHLVKLENIRRDFVANVSHELKTPITSIKGFVETLLDGGMDNPVDARHFLNIVAKHADRLNAIIEDLLSLSRIEQGVERNEIALDVGPVREVLEAAVRICEEKGRAKEIGIHLECDDAIQAKINPRLLEQAVVNLLDNAIKYSESGSTILVKGEEGVTITVADQGNGIPEEHLPRLFERFYRVDKARSRQEGGTGLGLAIVKHIVQSHKGRIEVESRLNEGTTFMIRLPE
jgi:two-component system phosphate regulon sensor histidine kinase PhoR